MVELELIRSPGSRRLYTIEGVGTLRFRGFLLWRASAEASGASWSFRRGGIVRIAIRASGATGVLVGEFAPRALTRGGPLRWEGRELELLPVSKGKQRYALRDQGQDLAVLDAKSFGKRPVRIAVERPDVVDPGLLLFVAFAARQMTDDANASAAAAIGTG
jgi:hypothetical protein